MQIVSTGIKNWGNVQKKRYVEVLEDDGTTVVVKSSRHAGRRRTSRRKAIKNREQQVAAEEFAETFAGMSVEQRERFVQPHVKRRQTAIWREAVTRKVHTDLKGVVQQARSGIMPDDIQSRYA